MLISVPHHLIRFTYHFAVLSVALSAAWLSCGFLDSVTVVNPTSCITSV